LILILLYFSLNLCNPLKICGSDFGRKITGVLNDQYGKDYEFDAPVKLLDKHLHAMAQSPDEQLVVVSQVCSPQALFLLNVYSSLLSYVVQLIHLALV
jgi:hypothetical protein